ncbi:hypothetical protein [Alkaliphilus hydrothermalis]|uniref:DUF5673 domain-containing protein n=1 Tax=Alkaliphilus hydrothermalis TaxID=1482730 RepID=A0ABS2NLA9_9FIRM|nr:hypothetical protein [Alkaliphilus hydrothermalis]MBM7613714.1 hypothetical protein [Alkaliphilus hydrothermalis]
MIKKILDYKTFIYCYWGAVFTGALALNITQTEENIIISIMGAFLLTIFFGIALERLKVWFIIKQHPMTKINFYHPVLQWLIYIGIIAMLVLQIIKWVTGNPTDLEPAFLLAVLGSNATLLGDLYYNNDWLVIMNKAILISDIKKIDVKKQMMNSYSFIVTIDNDKGNIVTSIKKDRLEELIYSHDMIAKLITDKSKIK